MFIRRVVLGSRGRCGAQMPTYALGIGRGKRAEAGTCRSSEKTRIVSSEFGDNHASRQVAVSCTSLAYSIHG